MNKQELLKKLHKIESEKRALAYELNDKVINSLDEKELSKLIINNERDVEIIKQNLNNIDNFIKGYKELLSW